MSETTRSVVDLRVGDRVAGTIRTMEILRIEWVERSTHPFKITSGLVYDGEAETSITREDRFAATDLVVMAEEEVDEDAEVRAAEWAAGWPKAEEYSDPNWRPF